MQTRYPTSANPAATPRTRHLPRSTSVDILPILAVLIAILVMSCVSPTTSDDKIGLPDDHVEQIDGVLHKRGAAEPYDYRNWCADPRCHHINLRGGYARAQIDGDGGLVAAATPSCYQCHGKLWQEAYPSFIRVLVPNAFTVWPQGASPRVEWWGPPAKTFRASLVRGGAEVAVLQQSMPSDGVVDIEGVRTEWGTGTGFQVRIEDDVGMVGMGRPFSICPPDKIPFISYPDSSSVFTHGQEFESRWECAAGVAVDLMLYRGSRLVDTIRRSAGNTGVLRRPFPSSWGTGDDFRVRIIDEDGNHTFSEPFTIEG